MDLTPPSPSIHPTLTELSESVLAWLPDADPDRIARASAGLSPEHQAAVEWLLWAHGVAPLLYSRLEADGGLGSIPPWLGDALSRLYEQNRDHVGVLLREMQSVLVEAAERRIAVMPLKGAIVAHRTYDEPALRPMGDIDLLVHGPDLGTVSGILARRGYRLSRSGPRHARFMMHSHQAAASACRGDPSAVFIELHVRVSESKWLHGGDITELLWHGSYRGSLGGSPACLPGAVDLLHHLLLHCAASIPLSRVRALQFCDICGVGSELNGEGWQELVSRAGAEGAQPTLYMPLALTHRWLGWQPPGGILEALRAQVPTRMARFLDQVPLTRLTPFRPLHAARAGTALLGPRQWLALLRHVALPTRSGLAVRYPLLGSPLSFPLAYGFHWARAVAQLARALLGRRRRVPSQLPSGGDGDA